MKTIKFTHRYDKILNCAGEPVETAMLLQVIRLNLSSLSPAFLQYDTEDMFDLPASGDYLMLIFEKGRGDIFTTLRRRTSGKEDYYTRLVGETCKVEITGETLKIEITRGN